MLKESRNLPLALKTQQANSCGDILVDQRNDDRSFLVRTVFTQVDWLVMMVPMSLLISVMVAFSLSKVFPVW